MLANMSSSDRVWAEFPCALASGGRLASLYPRLRTPVFLRHSLVLSGASRVPLPSARYPCPEVPCVSAGVSQSAIQSVSHPVIHPSIHACIHVLMGGPHRCGRRMSSRTVGAFPACAPASAGHRPPPSNPTPVSACVCYPSVVPQASTGEASGASDPVTRGLSLAT